MTYHKLSKNSISTEKISSQFCDYGADYRKMWTRRFIIFYPECGKSRVSAPFHMHKKRLKSCMRYKNEITYTYITDKKMTRSILGIFFVFIFCESVTGILKTRTKTRAILRDTWYSFLFFIVIAVKMSGRYRVRYSSIERKALWYLAMVQR